MTLQPLKEQTAIVSMRVVDPAKPPVAGSTTYPCDVCCLDVWIAPSSRPFIPTCRVLCVDCFLERATPEAPTEQT